MLCPVCGKSVERFHNGMCISCLVAEKNPVHLPEKILLTVCKDCNGILIGKHWEKFGSEKEGIKRLLETQIRCLHGFTCRIIEMECVEKDRNLFSCLLHLNLELENAEFVLKREVCVVRKHLLCPDCSRVHGHGFSAIIQVRRKGREIGEKVLMEIGKVIEGSGERKRQVIKKEIVRNGVDVYIADNAYARTVCEVLKTRYHAKLSVSPRLHTRKEGKDVYRVTYLVELNRFEVDDLIYYAGEFYIVRAIEGRNVVLASERKEVVVDEEALKNVEIITLKELQEVKVVYRDKDEVTVLDENTMKLERFSGMDYPADAEKMWLLKREENIYLVPYSVVKKMGGKL